MGVPSYVGSNNNKIHITIPSQSSMSGVSSTIPTTKSTMMQPASAAKQSPMKESSAPAKPVVPENSSPTPLEQNTVAYINNIKVACRHLADAIAGSSGDGVSLDLPMVRTALDLLHQVKNNAVSAALVGAEMKNREVFNVDSLLKRRDAVGKPKGAPGAAANKKRKNEVTID